MEVITVEFRIKAALRAKQPSAIRHYLQVVQRVRFYREESRRWEGRFMIYKICDNQVWVTDGVNRRNFNYAQVLSNPKDVE